MTSGKGRDIQKRNKDGYRVQAYSKGKYLPMESGDLTPVLDLAMKSLKRYSFNPNPPAYEDSEEGYKRFVEESNGFYNYLQTVNNDPNVEQKLIPDVEGWAIYLGITRKTIHLYSKRNETWAWFIGWFQETIGEAKKQLAYNGKIPPVFAMFDLVNNHGYVNTNEFHITAQVPIKEGQLTAEELKEKAAQLPGFDDKIIDVEARVIEDDERKDS